MKQLSLALCFLLGCGVSKYVKFSPIVVTQTIEYSDPRPMFVTRDGVKLYENHNTDSRVLGHLPQGTVVKAMAEAGSESSVYYYRASTRSGKEGWISHWYVDTITPDQAELAILRDKQRFEQTLQNRILTAAKMEIQNTRVHPNSSIESTWITSGGDAVGSTSSHRVNVRTIMVGKILGYNRFQVDTAVDLFIMLNRDHYSASRIEVNRATITDNRTIKEIPLKETFTLLQLFSGLLVVP